jgi:hypothetical protein
MRASTTSSGHAVIFPESPSPSELDELRIWLCFFPAVWTAAGCAPSPKIGYDLIAARLQRLSYLCPAVGRSGKTGDRRADSSAVDMRIRIAVGTQLRLKGYQTLPEGAGFLCGYQQNGSDSSPSISTQYYSDGTAGHAFSHSADTRSASGSAPSPQRDALVSSSLLIDVIDASQKPSGGEPLPARLTR